jgi:filamentous hemagglutinin family protein
MMHIKYWLFPCFFLVASAELCEAQVFGDKSTNVQSQDNLNFVVNGGSRVGENLFYSFSEFSVPPKGSVLLDNASDIRNVISRVTGNSISNIDGLIKTNSNANLFLINPKGIIFGSGAKLDVGGSFIATTADQIIFADDTVFSAASSQSEPILTASLPVGFRFGQRPGNIESRIDLNNRLVLSVNPGKTFALLGSGVVLENIELSEQGGKIEIGSVDASSFVGLSQIAELWNFDYKNVQFFQDIKLSNSRLGDSSSGGAVDLFGKQVAISNSSISSVTFGAEAGKGIKLYASESLEFNRSNLSSITFADGNAGDVIIDTLKLKVINGSQLRTSTLGAGLGGNLVINASDSAEVTGGFALSRLSTGSGSDDFLDSGNAGELKIVTSKLIVSEGGQISTSSIGQGNAGNLTIKASKLIDVSGKNTNGRIHSGLFSQSSGGSGNSGNLTIMTNQFSVRSGADVKVSSSGSGSAGTLKIDVNDLLLDNQGTLKAETQNLKGNIFVNATGMIRLRNNSTISTTAKGNANGGNITINTPILLALSPIGSEGSDIIAKATIGFGGKITINAQGIFGIQQRKANPGNQTNDIDASSQFGQSGQVQINTTTDPNQGLIELPATVIDPSTLVAQNPCRRASSSEFTRSGRGGLPPSLSQDLNSESTQVGLVEPTNLSAATPEPKSASKETSPLPLSSTKIVPAQGWVYNAKGEVVLVAYNSAVTGPQRLQSTPAGCPAF